MKLSNALYAALALSVLALPAGPAVAQSVSLNAILNGANECNGIAPPIGPVCMQGDLDGYGVATITLPTATTLCFSLLVNKIGTPTAAHIHVGVAGQNGGVAVILLPVPGSGNPGASAACVPSPAGFNASLRGNPSGFYVNVHNAAFPGGALRGQLF